MWRRLAKRVPKLSAACGSGAERRLRRMKRRRTRLAKQAMQAAEGGERATKKLAVLTDPYNTLIKQSRLRKVDIVAAAFSLHIL